MKTWVFMWRLIRYRPALYSVTAACWILVSLLPVVPGLLIQQFFNTVAKTPYLTRAVWELIILFLLTAGVRAVFILLSAVLGNLSRFSMSGLIRHNLLKYILERPGAQALPASPGEAISIFRDDVQQAEDAVDWSIDVMGQGLFALVAVVILLRISVVTTLSVFLPLVAVIALAQLLSKRLQTYREVSRQATGEVTSALGEIFRSVQAIKLARAEGRVAEHFQTLNERRQRASLNDKVLEQVFFSTANNVVSLGTGLVLLLMAGSLRTLQLGVGDLAIFLYYLAFISDFTQFFGMFLGHYAQTGVAFRRMTTLQQGVPAANLVTHRSLLLSERLAQTPSLLPAAEHPALQLLEVKGISYHYPGTERGIEGIDLRVQRGTMTVITGQVASGKTTLLRAVLGLIPKEAGDIYWNGILVSDPAAFFVPPQSAYTAQVPKLFSMTVKQNMLFGLPEHPDALEGVIHTAVLEHDLASFRHGVEERIGAGGIRLSGGQVQRVAAARMLLRQAALLVVDDVSSALDGATEQRFWDRLFAQPSTVTCLVVSHRRAVFQRADHIVVLKEGRMEAEGTVEQLLDSSEEFRRLWSGRREEVTDPSNGRDDVSSSHLV